MYLKLFDCNREVKISLFRYLLLVGVLISRCLDACEGSNHFLKYNLKKDCVGQPWTRNFR